MADNTGINFQFVSLDSNLLGAYYGAKQASAGLLTMDPVLSNVSLGSQNALLTPWDQDNAIARERASGNTSTTNLYKLLSKDFTDIEKTSDFINRRDALVRNTKIDKDSKALFILYNALKDLKTVAEYASDSKTSASKMASIEQLFQLGFGQAKDFIKTESLDKLKLLYGEKATNVSTKLGLGKKQYDYIGPQIHQGKLTDPISSLVGGEAFTITITRDTSAGGVVSQVVNNFAINVPVLAADRSLGALISQINAKIQAIKTLDVNGKEILQYNTKFFAEELSTDKFGLRIKTDFNEKMTFSALDVAPALYITGNTASVDYLTKQANPDIPTTSFVTKLNDLAAIDATKEFQKSLFSNQSEALLVPEKTATTAVPSPLARAAETTSNAIATDSAGSFFVVGASDGRFANHLNTSTTGDAYLNKYDASGKLLWSRLVGSLGDAKAYSITIDSLDNVIIAGQADKLSAGVSSNPLAIGDNVFSGKDSFIVKYDNVGTQQWMYINDKYGTDAAMSVTTDSLGDVYVTGQKNINELSSTVLTGSDNAYVMKLDGFLGTKKDYVEIGSSTTDFGQAIAVAADGNIIVATHEANNLVLQKLDKTNLASALWTYDFGDMGVGSNISDIAVEGSRIYVAGSSNNSLVGSGTQIAAPLGGLDGFVLALDDLGASATADWTKFVGSTQSDSSGGLTVSGGKIYLSGTTAGDVNGAPLQGGTDSFAMKIDGTTGATDWSKQLGFATENRTANGIAFATLGSSVLTKLGLPIGGFVDDEKRIIATQSTARAGDYFYIKINNLITKKIEIKDGDTFRTIANRINRASFRYIKATVTFNSGSSSSAAKAAPVVFDAKAIIAEKLKAIQDKRNGVVTQETFVRENLDVYGNSLKIASIDGGNIEIIAGRGEKDALKKIGLDPTLILSAEELFGIKNGKTVKNPKKLGGAFAFKLDDRFSVLDKRDARYVTQELEYALGIVKSAFRSLTFDPLAEQIKQNALKKTGGTVPPYLLKQLSNYQEGLRRISSGSATGAGLFI